MRGVLLVVLIAISVPAVAAAQQRPLVTEDPESIGAGRLLVEVGVDYLREQLYTVSGLQGNLLRLPTLGVSIGLGPNAELQMDGGIKDTLSITSRMDAPLSGSLTVLGTTTDDYQDLSIGAKMRLISERGRRPSFASRFSTRLPNAGNESGLGTDTLDFFTSLLIGKTIRSVRVVGNIGLGILSDPTRGDRQNDVLTYGISMARALTTATEVVGELNGRASTREGDPFPGTESRSLLRMGMRYTRGAGRLDGAVIFGLTSVDPSIGFTFGYTHVFAAFRTP
jgi:hypothetical protein